MLAGGGHHTVQPEKRTTISTPVANLTDCVGVSVMLRRLPYAVPSLLIARDQTLPQVAQLMCD
jgi:hypothetical protein